MGLTYPITNGADYDFSREAAAYEVLRDEKVDGELVPKYYVRIILIESVPVVSIDKLLEDERKYKSIPVALRLGVLAKAIEIICRLEYHGVRHDDFTLRNIIVSHDDGWETRLPTVRVIDFGVAQVTRSPYNKTNHEFIKEFVPVEDDSPPQDPYY
ncbi:hypothetical protein F503_02064 [Ophiostoma piceae UAMH 11346]|uniref:EKC/KEOPS complex subunit BUD32 n=1 Tax=Ophiostoma piceae (strain UAMH 11346) TaxID=1262450 RepID=S3CWX9_OPHP1|nr:hypothetical protein F503_02064 [Ophiostoma piceae UAMH 11346]